MEKELSGSEEYDNNVRLVKKLANFITIWPVDLRDVNGDEIRYLRARKLQRCHSVFILISFVLLFSAQVAEAIQNWGDLNMVTENCVSGSCCILVVFRITFYVTGSKNVEFVVEKMRNDWVSASDEDRAILRKICAPAFQMSTYFTYCVGGTMCICMMFPIIGVRLCLHIYHTYGQIQDKVDLLCPFLTMYLAHHHSAIVMRMFSYSSNRFGVITHLLKQIKCRLSVTLLGGEEWVLPYGGYFGGELSPSSFICVYIIEVISGYYGFCNVSSVNSINIISITHGSAKFLILQSHLTALRSNDKISEKLLRSYIQDHQRAIEFADYLEEMINKVALLQFIVSTALVCCIGLQITALSADKLRLAKYCGCLGSAIFELFLFSYGGHQLTTQSESIGNAAFNSDWVSSAFTQNLHIMMTRATKPSKITAAKFYDMSLESFSMVLSTSFSYFTTLRAMSEE